MKITAKETIQEDVEIITDLICNKCEGSLNYYGGLPHDPIKLSDKKKKYHHFYGLAEAHVGGGYNSKYLLDLHQYTFSMCEKCLVELFESFKIKPDIHCASDARDYTWEEDRAIFGDMILRQNQSKAVGLVFDNVEINGPISKDDVETLFFCDVGDEKSVFNLDKNIPEICEKISSHDNLMKYYHELFEHAWEESGKQANSSRVNCVVWADEEKTKLRAPTIEEQIDSDILEEILYSNGGSDALELLESQRSHRSLAKVKAEDQEAAYKASIKRLVDERGIVTLNFLTDGGRLHINTKSDWFENHKADIEPSTLEYLYSSAKYTEFQK